MFYNSEFLWERIPSSASGTLVRMVGTALFLPSVCQLNWCWGLSLAAGAGQDAVYGACSHGARGKHCSSFGLWVMAPLLLIGQRTSPFMRLCLTAQFNLGVVLPGCYSTEAVAVFQLTTMERGASLQVSTMYKCDIFKTMEILRALSWFLLNQLKFHKHDLLLTSRAAFTNLSAAW